MTWGELKRAIDDHINDDQQIAYIDIDDIKFEERCWDVSLRKDGLVQIV